MTYRIELERLGPIGADGFAKLVEQRIATLREYDAHEATVRAHALVPDMVDPWTTLPIPEAPIEIDASIRRTLREDGTAEFTADYELVGPSFEVKKARLFQRVTEAEHQALAGVLPQGKVRAFQFREMDIRAADEARYHEAFKAAADPSNLMSFDEFCLATRSEDDTRFLEGQASREARRQEIIRAAAERHSDIEDLSPDTIDTFEMKPF